jgi:putative ABC transport system permease protein
MLDALSSQEFVSDVYEQYYYSLNISCGEKTEKALVNAMDPACKLVGLYTKDGTALDMPDNGIVLDTTLAEKLGVSEGSTVEVGGKSMTVSKIDFQSISRVQYIPMSEAEGLGGASFYCIICKVSKENEQKLIEYMTENDDYIFTLFVSVLKEGDKRNFATYDAIAWILIGFAVILGLIIIVNTTNTNLLEQKKELCVLRTLGFQHSELSRQWFIQSLLQFICSVIIGLISGGFIARVSLENLSNEAREYVYANGTKEYVLTVALVFAFIVVSHIIAMRSLKKWDMVETVKEKE